MKKFLVGLLLMVTATACGSSDATGPGKGGPLAMGLISGNHQVALAGAAQLPAPVVGKLVRKPDGSVAFIQQLPNKALDLFVPRAFAQSGTVVTGSPVAGAVVCAVSVTDSLHAMTPFVPCTNTQSDGTATFFFTTGTKVGEAKAEIRGTLNGEPAVFDTAVAVVVPDTTSAQLTGDLRKIGYGVHGWNRVTNSTYPARAIHVGDTVNYAGAITGVVDKYGNVIDGAISGTFTWTLVQLTTDTFVGGFGPGITNDTLPYPPTIPAPLSSGEHSGGLVTGWQKGYVLLNIFYNGKFLEQRLFAVFP